MGSLEGPDAVFMQPEPGVQCRTVFALEATAVAGPYVSFCRKVVIEPYIDRLSHGGNFEVRLSPVLSD
jgi:hypothetical protein